MDSESSRPTRVQVIGALSLIAVVVVVVLGIFWVQSIDTGNERARCEESALVQSGAQSVDDCVAVGD